MQCKIDRAHKLNFKKPKRNIQSEWADPKRGVAIREGKWRIIIIIIYIRKFAATEEAIAVGQCGVVLETPLLRPAIRRREVSGAGLRRPFLDRIGESVVHCEGEDASMARGVEEEAPNGNQEENIISSHKN